MRSTSRWPCPPSAHPSSPVEVPKFPDESKSRQLPVGEEAWTMTRGGVTAKVVGIDASMDGIDRPVVFAEVESSAGRWLVSGRGMRPDDVHERWMFGDLAFYPPPPCAAPRSCQGPLLYDLQTGTARGVGWAPADPSRDDYAVSDFVWSPDGSAIAWVEIHGDDTWLSLLHVEDAAIAHVRVNSFVGGGNEADSQVPRWSEDGQRLLLTEYARSYAEVEAGVQESVFDRSLRRIGSPIPALLSQKP